MRAVVSLVDHDDGALLAKVRSAPEMVGQDLVREVTADSPYQAGRDKMDFLEFSEVFSTLADPWESRFRVVAYDFGIKSNILRDLTSLGAEVTVVPASTAASDVLALDPDGVFLSNGPGDPEAVEYAIRNVRDLLGRKPVFGICLGHQIMGLALGGKTFKLKFGHHGGNQPVQRLASGKVEITAQNHGFAVDADSLDLNQVRITHVNLNDHTVEGLEHKGLPAFSVQYHPEASPGPHDSYYLFKQFFDLMRDAKTH
jgi:carbamoyl-phosphate synthase small subunit